jgi:hypothetical protein
MKLLRFTLRTNLNGKYFIHSSAHHLYLFLLFRTLKITDTKTRYPECATLTVTGSGTASPSGNYLASIPGVYSMSDPNIDIDVYSNANSGVTVCIPKAPFKTEIQ